MTTGPYRVAEVEDADNTPCTCENCGWTGTADAVDEIEDCALTPGDPSPVGRCPECDCLAYVERPLRANPLDLRLLEMVCELEDYLCAIRDETLDGSEPELAKLLQKSAALREAFAQRTEVVQPMAPPHAAPKLWLAVVEHEAVPGAKLKLLAQPAEPTAEQILPHFAGELGLGESLDDLYVNGVFDVTHELQYRGNLQAFKETAAQMGCVAPAGEIHKIVVQLDDDGGSPGIKSNRPVAIAILRHGKDLKDYDEEDIFDVPSRDLPGRMEQAVGHFADVPLDEAWVEQIFAAVSAHHDVDN